MKSASTTRIIIGTMLGVCIILLSRYNALCEYTVEGIATFGQANPKFPPMRFNLTLESRNDEYRITAKAIDGEWHNDEVTTGDGLDNYFLDQTWPSWEAKNKNENYIEIGTVAEGYFPVNSLSIVQLTWLTYCSASHFHVGTNSASIPLRCTKSAPSDDLTQIVSFATSTPNIVDKIQCFAPAVLYVSDGTKKISLKPPYDKGYLLWELHVTTFTNVGRLTLPLSFEYAQYFPKVGNGTNSMDLNCVIRGKFEVENIIDKVSSQSLLPTITQKNVRIADWRFHLDRGATNSIDATGTPVVAYQVSDGQWRKRNDSGINSQMIAIQQSVHSSLPAKSSPVVKGFTYFALIVSTLFLGWFIRREIKFKKEKTKDKI